jgi:hypothetical protein
MSLFRHDDSIKDRTQRVRLPEPTRRSVAAWLAELPLANTAYCFEALQGALEFFNARPNLPPPLRLELAELLRPTVCVMAQRTEAQCADAPLPYSGEIEAHIRRRLDLHRELGQSYALACFDPLGFGGRSKEAGHLAHAIFRALQQSGLWLLWTAQLYQTPGEDYWSQLYRLYGLAEARNLLLVRFEDAEEPESCRTTAGVFKRCLLFFLANSRRFRQRDISHIFALLGGVGEYGHVGVNASHEGEPAEFALDLGIGRPPSRSQAIIESETAGLRFLSTRELVRVLNGSVEAGGGGAKKAMPGKAVLRRVARSLGGVENRGPNRRPASSSCRYVVGLSRVIEAWPPIKHSSPISERGGAAPVIGASASTSRGRIVNSSPRGCCIVSQTGPTIKARVGEVIGIWEDESPLIGTISRLAFEANRLEIGVELLASCAQVVDFFDDDGNSRGKALLLPIDRAAAHPLPELLILPSMIKVGTSLRLRAEDRIATYWVQRELEGTPSLARYELAETNWNA